MVEGLSSDDKGFGPRQGAAGEPEPSGDRAGTASEQAHDARVDQTYGDNQRKSRDPWLERSGPTRSHPEPGSETLQRRWYCLLKGVGD